MNILPHLLHAHDCKPRPEPATAALADLEAQLPFALPEDYRWYLLHYNALEDTIGPEYVVLFDIPEILEINETIAELKALEDIIIIGSNGSGEYIALEKTGATNGRVILLNMVGLDVSIEIGFSFSDFLVRLENGMEWFRH